jgi:hypothetical protein
LPRPRGVALAVPPGRRICYVCAITRLHVVYRSYGPSNTKDRPPFYSKLLALTSLVRAAEEAGQPVELVFLNDGPIPQDRLNLMQAAGEVVMRSHLGFRGSYHAGLALPLKRGWPDEDLVWFSEDDYLYQARALRDLVAAAEAKPEAAYLALYASIGHRPPEGGEQPDYAPVPTRWHESAPVPVNGHSWRRGLSTTWTFGTRMWALREDRPILALSDYAGLGGCDHAMCLFYQGLRPFPWGSLGRDLLLTGPGDKVRRAKRFAIVPVKVVFNAWSYTRARRGRLIFAADPALATHLESGHLALGTDWLAVAQECAAWAAERGVSVALPVGSPPVAK